MQVQRIQNNNYNSSFGIRSTYVPNPDYLRLKSRCKNLLASCYFRRGQWYDFANKDLFKQVVDIFQKVFEETKRPKGMLIVGVADSQEPFSYLAVINEIAKKQNKRLEDIIDLHTVDLQRKPWDIKIRKDSFFDAGCKPPFAESSFYYDRDWHGKSIMYHWRVKKHICDYLENTYNNPQKSKWDTRIQDVANSYNNESLDIISINNVLGYIDTAEAEILTLKQLIDKLKKGGFLITDPLNKDVLYRNGISNIEEIGFGIYQKK